MKIYFICKKKHEFYIILFVLNESHIDFGIGLQMRGLPEVIFFLHSLGTGTERTQCFLTEFLPFESMLLFMQSLLSCT